MNTHYSSKTPTAIVTAIANGTAVINATMGSLSKAILVEVSALDEPTILNVTVGEIKNPDNRPHRYEHADPKNNS